MFIDCNAQRKALLNDSVRFAQAMGPWWTTEAQHASKRIDEGKDTEYEDRLQWIAAVLKDADVDYKNPVEYNEFLKNLAMSVGSENTDIPQKDVAGYIEKHWWKNNSAENWAKGPIKEAVKFVVDELTKLLTSTISARQLRIERRAQQVKVAQVGRVFDWRESDEARAYAQKLLSENVKIFLLDNGSDSYIIMEGESAKDAISSYKRLFHTSDSGVKASLLTSTNLEAQLT